MKLIPCVNLNHNQSDFRGVELCTMAPHYPDVKYFTREAPYQGAATKVQFCNKIGRVDGVFDCYQSGFKHCYEPTPEVSAEQESSNEA